MTKAKAKTPEELEAAKKKKLEAAEKKEAEKTESASEVVEHQFNPKKLSPGNGSGFWKYNEDASLVTRETFRQQRARDFGIKENDVVFVSLNGNVEILGV